MDRSHSLGSSAPENILQGDYQLALKLFINKDFSRSFDIIRKLQKAAFQSFNRSAVGEEIYIKITILYLTEVGLLLAPVQSANSFTLSGTDRSQVEENLKNDVIFQQIEQLYGGFADAPSELVFHVFLVYFTCRNVVEKEKENTVLSKFKGAFHALDLEEKENDRHLKRWFDLYVLNVLPEAGDFDTAYSIARNNRAFGGESIVARLKEAEKAKSEERVAKDKQEKGRKAMEAKRLAAEKEREKKAKQERSLKYRSMKQIKDEQESREASRKEQIQKDAKASVSVPTLDRIRARLIHLFNLSKTVLRDQSPVILAIIIVLLISGQFFRARKINFKQKFKDTLSMAFKVSYL